MDDGIFILKNYGKVKFCIKETMSKKKITRNKLSKLTGCTYNVIDRYYKGNITRVDLDVLAKICFVLECNVSDIIQYENDK